MSESEDILRKLRALKPALKGWNITRLRVFGSVLHGTAGPNSDVDLIVDFDEKPGLFGFVGIKRDLEEKLGRKVDLLTEQSIDPLLRDRILREATDV